MRRKTKKVTVDAGPTRKRIEIEIAANASEREIDSAIARKLIDWAQIEEGRHEIEAGGGETLDEILANAQSPANVARQAKPSRVRRRHAS